MPADAGKLVKEAHATCPCDGARGYGCDPFCRCYTNAEAAERALGVDRINVSVECIWPGHAAIDAALRAAFEAGYNLHADNILRVNSGLGKAPLPDWLPKERAE